MVTECAETDGARTECLGSFAEPREDGVEEEHLCDRFATHFSLPQRRNKMIRTAGVVCS